MNTLIGALRPVSKFDRLQRSSACMGGMELSEAIEVPRVNEVFMRKGPRPSQVGSLVLIGEHSCLSIYELPADLRQVNVSSIAGHHLIFSPNAQTPLQDRSSDELWVGLPRKRFIYLFIYLILHLKCAFKTEQ